MWSHKFEIPSQSFGGATFRVYSCSPELSGGNTSTTPTHIGVIVHEIGHTLGLWDMYNTGSGNVKGLGPWSLMADGSWNHSGRTPPYLNAFERYMLGWLTPTVLNVGEYHEITLPPLGPNNVAYVFYAKNSDGTIRPNERFYIENRNTTSTGLWDSRISSNSPPGPSTGGLMIYHMDSTVPSAWIRNVVNTPSSSYNTASRESFRIISAKGCTVPCITISGFGSQLFYDHVKDVFCQTTMDSLTDNSTPNTKSWAGVPTGIPIRNITRNTTNNHVSFTVGNKTCNSWHAFNASFCEGKSFNFNGKILTAAGTYRDTLINAAGCDSIITLTLTQLQNSTSAINGTFCQGKSFKFNDSLFTTPGKHTITLKNVAGCDSIITLTLTQLNNSSSTVERTILQGDSTNFNGTYYKVAGSYPHTLVNSVGCDSIVTLVLSVTPTSNMPTISESGIMKIIPNPIVDGELRITNYEPLGRRSQLRMGASTPLSDRVEIFDMKGNRVLSQRIPLLTTHYSLLTINVSHLPNGTYIVRIVTSTGSIVGSAKIVKL